MLDSDLRPHLLEVNTKPQLLPQPLDTAVNKPMVEEMFRLVGFHLPPAALFSRREAEAVCRVFQLDDVEQAAGFRYKLYSRVTEADQLEKEERVAGLPPGSRDLLHPLTPLDVRRLIKAEDELNATQSFQRVFPGPDSQKYLELLEPLPYSDLLMDAYEREFGGDRDRGRQLLESYCRQRVHLS
jgi:tubulin polyglutamylase TTLL4